MEDELLSHQHEEQWLRDKGSQLAQRDAELAGEVLREISLLETTWGDTRRVIAERYWRKKRQRWWQQQFYCDTCTVIWFPYYCALIDVFPFFCRQEQCSVLHDLMRQFQTLKTSISSVFESTEPLVDISSVLKDHEETRRSLTKVRPSSTLYFFRGSNKFGW